MSSTRASGGLWALAAVAVLASLAAAQTGVIPYDGPDLGLNTFITTNINSADTVNANLLWTGGGLGLNLSGAGLTVGVWDGGYARTTHQEFGGRVTVKDSGGSTIDHATHVIGTIAAAGIDPNARGMANQVNVWSYEWTDDTTEMAAAASSIVASNHSYAYTRGWTYSYFSSGPNGSGNYGVWNANRYSYTEDPYFGKYDSTAQALDQVLYSNPNLLSVWAASNDRNETRASYNSYYLTMLVGGPYNGWYWVPVTDPTYPAPAADGSQAGGYDCLPQEQTAKNNLVVGAIQDITADPYNSANVTMTTFSSWGPTDDGRVKPDVVACGYKVHSTMSGSDTAYNGDPAMGDSQQWNGTSMAAPNVTGTATLLIEHYQNVRGSLPRSATTKGIIIHTAFDAGNAGPDYVYGWGVMKADDAANLITDSVAPGTMDAIFEAGYSGEVWDRLVYAGGSGSLKTTVVWTDPAPTILPGAGLDDATSVLVHDLDVLLYASAGGPYYPWTLDPANPSSPAVRTAANHRDNVEQVLVDAPAGWYAISVSGGAYSQDFSLVVSGGEDFGAGSLWRGNPSGPSDWSVAGNWAPLVPRPADIALIDNGGTAVISGGSVSVRMIAAGERYSGAVTQSGGTTVVQDGLHLGHTAAAKGTFTLSAGRVSVGGTVDLGGAAGAQGVLNLAGGSLTAAGPIMLASGAGGTGHLSVSKTAYVMVGGLIASTGGSGSSLVSLEMDSDGHGLIHATAVSTLGGTVDVQAAGSYRPREGDLFTVIASTDPSGVHFVGGFSAFTGNIVLGLPAGSAPFGGQVNGNDYDLVFLGYTEGDANGNHWVDAGDLSLMGAGWQLSGQSWATGDFTGNGAVDGGDLSLLGANWSWHLPSPPPGGAPVPEPAVLALLGLGAAALLRKRRL